ncbi:hypothetical protein [Gracilinema caldarium]|uniref:Uncharacterized protein n=1 Tax=Gracilinema caldarium (strain ATCC 51460 / DSM 7334 / H1) TaxID=744872 RepID=F8F184_GRAC1|nr:hypothetical protein [Gracilinema caldarium]AEJ18728.1 hypothetical protein Spica_0568 [Gracilinema caldarium DSM 7334]
MPQLSIYIDEPTLEKVEKAAKRHNTSISKWVVEQLKASIDPVYPASYENLFGSIDDSTFTEPNELHFGADMKRESL